jgi:hypothetical protein
MTTARLRVSNCDVPELNGDWCELEVQHYRASMVGLEVQPDKPQYRRVGDEEGRTWLGSYSVGYLSSDTNAWRMALGGRDMCAVQSNSNLPPEHGWSSRSGGSVPTLMFLRQEVQALAPPAPPAPAPAPSVPAPAPFEPERLFGDCRGVANAYSAMINAAKAGSVSTQDLMHHSSAELAELQFARILQQQQRAATGAPAPTPTSAPALESEMPPPPPVMPQEFTRYQGRFTARCITHGYGGCDCPRPGTNADESQAGEEAEIQADVHAEAAEPAQEAKMPRRHFDISTWQMR